MLFFFLEQNLINLKNNFFFFFSQKNWNQIKLSLKLFFFLIIKKIINNIWIVFVGEEGSGKVKKNFWFHFVLIVLKKKTSLLNTLKGKKLRKNEFTDGVVIDSSWKEQTPYGEVTLRTFDFGGHLVYCILFIIFKNHFVYFSLLKNIQRSISQSKIIKFFHFHFLKIKTKSSCSCLQRGYTLLYLISTTPIFWTEWTVG